MKILPVKKVSSILKSRSSFERSGIHCEVSKRERQSIGITLGQQNSASPIYCPRCGNVATRKGKMEGVPRFKCQNFELSDDGSRVCGRTFNALTGTPLAGLHLARKNIGNAAKCFGGTDDLSVLLSRIRT